MHGPMYIKYTTILEARVKLCLRVCVCVCLHACRRLWTFVRAQKIEMRHAFKLPCVGELFGRLLNANQRIVDSRHQS